MMENKQEKQEKLKKQATETVQGRQGFPVVFLGDSLTAGFQVPHRKGWVSLLCQKYGWNGMNKGIPGDTMAGMLCRFREDVVKEQPAAVVITGGVNDILLGSPVGVVMANLSAMVHQAWYYKIVPITGICTAFQPEQPEAVPDLAEYRQALLQYLKGYQYRRFDFDAVIKGHSVLQKDGLHFSLEGHERIAEAANVYLEKLYQKKLDRACLRWQFEQ